MASQEKRLRIGLANPVRALDPRGTLYSRLVLAQLYEALYEAPDGDGQPRPLLLAEPLVEEQTASGQPLFSGRLLDGVLFSDGTRLDAAAVASSLSSLAWLETDLRARADGDRLLLELERPFPGLDLTLSIITTSILKQEGTALFGTGAYVEAPDSTPEAIHLVRNPHYRTPVDIEEIVCTVFAPEEEGSSEELIQAISEGRIDYTNCLTREDTKRLSNVRKSIEPGDSTSMLFFNAERPPFDRPQVRRALAAAIDREAVSRLFYPNPLAYTARGLYPRSADALPDGVRYSLVDARRTLAAAGASLPNRKLELAVIWGPRPYLPRPLEAAELIVSQLRGLNVEVEVVPTEDPAGYYRCAAEGDYDLMLAGWIPDTPNPVDFFEAAFASASVPDTVEDVGARVNLSRWKNGAMDEALERYRESPGAQPRAALARLFQEELPFLPLLHGPNVVVHSWRLKNYPSSFVAPPRFAGMSLRG